MADCAAGDVLPPKPLAHPLTHAAATAVCATLLAVPALVNGYPLAFYDSADYIDMSFTWRPIVYRTMPYALLVLPAHPPVASLWAVVVLQCLLAGWVVATAVRAFLPAASVWTPGIVAGLLASLTALPWYAGQIMPDFLAGLLAVALATLLFARPAPGWPSRGGLIAIALLAATCHATLTLLAIGMAVATLGIWLAAGRQRRQRLGLAFVALPALIAAGGMAGTAAIHKAATGRAFISQGGDIFLLARFMQDGLVKPYLDRVCPSPRYRLCAYRDHLPDSANDFLWAYDNLLDKIGGWQGARDEAGRIVHGSLAAFPLRHLRAALRDVGAQLAEFDTGDGTWSQLGGTAVAVARHFPDELPAYLNALQQRDRWDFDRINLIHVPVAIVGLAGLVVLGLVRWRRGDLAGAGLALVLALAILGNATICGVLSNPVDRYGSRMVWIGVFGTMILLARPFYTPPLDRTR
jgi:hypothetical protein